VGGLLVGILKGVNRTGDNKGFLLFYLYPEGARGVRKSSRGLSTMWRAVNYNVEAGPSGRPEGAGGQLDLRGCLVDRSGSGRGIDSERTEGKRGTSG
jgi:hypothetical protein